MATLKDSLCSYLDHLPRVLVPVPLKVRTSRTLQMTSKNQVQKLGLNLVRAYFQENQASIKTVSIEARQLENFQNSYPINRPSLDLAAKMLAPATLIEM